MKGKKITVLLVEDNQDFARLVSIYLDKYDEGRFSVLVKPNGEAALKELESNPEIDVVLMDYFLPGKNGLEITRAIRKKRVELPIIFVTVNKDFELAVEVMKLGVDDYLVKEEISSPVLPMTIVSALERKRLKDQLTQLEVSQERLEVMREMALEVVESIREPLRRLEESIETLASMPSTERYANFLKIMRDNVHRITAKVEKLKSIDADKTVQYIKDIRMIDLS